MHLFGYPECLLRNEGFVAGAEMNHILVPSRIVLGFDRLVRVDQEANALVVDGKISELLILTRRFQHFQQSSRILPVVLVLDLPVVEIKVLAAEIR